MEEILKSQGEQKPDRAEAPELQDTGVKIYHAPKGAHYTIKARVRQGEGKVFVNGVPISELIESGQIRRTEELLQVLNRERLKALDINLELGESLPTDILSPSILSYAIAEALTNLLGRL